jgi:hypothetical protein
VIVDDNGKVLGGMVSSTFDSDSVRVQTWLETAHGPGLLTLTGSRIDTPNGGLLATPESVNLWFTTADCSSTPYFVSTGSEPFQYHNPDGARVYVGAPNQSIYSSEPTGAVAISVQSARPQSSEICITFAPTATNGLPLTFEGELGTEFAAPFSIVPGAPPAAILSTLGGRAQFVLALALVFMLAFGGRGGLGWTRPA